MFPFVYALVSFLVPDAMESMMTKSVSVTVREIVCVWTPCHDHLVIVSVPDTPDNTCASWRADSVVPNNLPDRNRESALSVPVPHLDWEVLHR